MNYYNEFDPFAAEWLKELIKAGLIPNGEVDTRSIANVSPDDLRSYTQCHFFAGIGGWSHALRLAGWADDRPIWTGSCPCQPFSVAGKGKGKDDERHLWPVFHKLIAECRPPVVMGEQVAGKAGYDWFDGVAADLEAEGYASRAVDIPACAVNAPHIRQRLYWCAVVNTDGAGQREHSRPFAVPSQQPSAQCAGGDAFNMAQPNGIRHDGACGNAAITSCNGENDGLSIGSGGELCVTLADANGGGCAGRQESQERRQEQGAAAERVGGCDMADAKPHNSGCETKSTNNVTQEANRPANQHSGCGGSSLSITLADANKGRSLESVNTAVCTERMGSSQFKGDRGFWDDTEWLTGADGKTRRSQPGVRLLVNGLPNRVGLLRGFGNAIVPPLAAEVIKAFMEVYGE